MINRSGHAQTTAVQVFYQKEERQPRSLVFQRQICMPQYRRGGPHVIASAPLGGTLSIAGGKNSLFFSIFDYIASTLIGMPTFLME